MIVLAANGVSAVRAIRLGSNTRKVVRRSSCPVLVLPEGNRVAAEDFLEKAGTREARAAASTATSAAGAGAPR